MDPTVKQRCYTCYCCERIFLRKNWQGNLIEKWSKERLCCVLLSCPECTFHQGEYCQSCKTYNSEYTNPVSGQRVVVGCQCKEMKFKNRSERLVWNKVIFNL